MRMTWGRKRARQRSAELLVFRTARDLGNVILTFKIARDYNIFMNQDDLERLLQAARTRECTDPERAKQLSALLSCSFRWVSVPHPDKLAVEILQLDPTLKPEVAAIGSRISEVLRTRLVREMLDKKEVAPHEILKAIPVEVLPQDAWRVDFCQRLVYYALQKDDIHTACDTASRLSHSDLPEDTWRSLMWHGVRAVEAGVMMQKHLLEFARVAAG